jgi:hypothetical protein
MSIIVHIVSHSMSSSGSDDDNGAEYSVTVLSVPRNGSCFYTSIAMALTDGVDLWSRRVRSLLRQNWQKYIRMRRMTGCTENMSIMQIDSDFVRFIAASNLVKDDLDTYNNLCMDEGGEVFETIEQVQDDVTFNNAWANLVIIRALLRGLQFTIGLIIFDAEEGKVAPLPLEWTQDKDQYVLLELKDLHYSVVRLTREADDVDMPLLMDRDTAIKALQISG